MSTIDNKRLMRAAIAEARRGIRAGQTPFGACIARNGKVIATAHNRVWQTGDVTAHAEIVAIRQACRKLGTIDLSGCVIYSTTEPCPMCFSACHWAGLSTIIFGTSIRDAKAAGFRELRISNRQMKRRGGARLRIQPGFLRCEAKRLFEEWRKNLNRRTY